MFCVPSLWFRLSHLISLQCKVRTVSSFTDKSVSCKKEPYNRNTSRFIISQLLFIHQLEVALLLSQQACVQSDTNFLRERLAKSAQGSKSNDSPTQSPMGVVRVYVIRINPEFANLANKDAAFWVQVRICALWHTWPWLWRGSAHVVVFGTFLFVSLMIAECPVQLMKRSLSAQSGKKVTWGSERTLWLYLPLVVLSDKFYTATALSLCSAVNFECCLSPMSMLMEGTRICSFDRTPTNTLPQIISFPHRTISYHCWLLGTSSRWDTHHNIWSWYVVFCSLECIAILVKECLAL